MAHKDKTMQSRSKHAEKVPTVSYEVIEKECDERAAAEDRRIYNEDVQEDDLDEETSPWQSVLDDIETADED